LPGNKTDERQFFAPGTKIEQELDELARIFVYP
jgi:hypothetical protein